MSVASRRPLFVAAGAAAAALALVVVMLLSSSSDGTRAGVVWDGAPKVVRVPELPRDRVLVGNVRNTSDETLRLDAERVVVLDAAGHHLQATARFAAGFGHGLYSPADPPGEVAANEQRRLGAIAELEPGETAPLTLSWRLAEGGDRAVGALVGDAVLALPAGG